MTRVNSIFVTAKCSDLCHINFKDEHGNSIGERDGYVPDWMPENHYGDYVELEIEIATGRILNWKVPSQKELKDSME
jgi:hypothetical protein